MVEMNPPLPDQPWGLDARAARGGHQNTHVQAKFAVTIPTAEATAALLTDSPTAVEPPSACSPS